MWFWQCDDSEENIDIYIYGKISTLNDMIRVPTSPRNVPFGHLRRSDLALVCPWDQFRLSRGKRHFGVLRYDGNNWTAGSKRMSAQEGVCHNQHRGLYALACRHCTLKQIPLFIYANKSNGSGKYHCEIRCEDKGGRENLLPKWGVWAWLPTWYYNSSIKTHHNDELQQFRYR